MIRHLLYRSRQAYDFRNDDLLRLLLAARRHKGERGITGLLLYRDGVFMQLLEGARDEVERLYASSAADPRHRDVDVLHSAEDEARLMPGWHMAYAQAPRLDGADVFAGLVNDGGALRLLGASLGHSGITAAMQAFLGAGAGVPGPAGRALQ